MGDVQFIIPAPGDSTYTPVDADTVELARNRTVQGRLFEKHILNKGVLLHPQTGEKIAVDDAFVRTLQQNFDRGVCDIVQVPLANSKNEHVENPDANIGEVVGIRERGGKVYSLIDARDEASAEKLGRTLLGASAFLHMNYKDSATGKRVGPTLLHVAVTNRPYVTGLDDYKEVLAATAGDEGEVVVLTPEPPVADNTGEVVVTPEEPDVPKTKDELLAELKEQHGIDVEALQVAATAAQPPAAPAPDAAALSTALVDALRDAGFVGLAASAGDAGDGLSQSDVVNAVVELANTAKSQAGRIGDLERQAAAVEVDGYIAAGRVLPKQREAYIDMALSNRDMMAVLLPDEPVVKLTQQEGVAGPDGEQRHKEDIDSDIARLTAEHSQFFTPNGTKAR